MNQRRKLRMYHRGRTRPFMKTVTKPLSLCVDWVASKNGFHRILDTMILCASPHSITDQFARKEHKFCTMKFSNQVLSAPVVSFFCPTSSRCGSVQSYSFLTNWRWRCTSKRLEVLTNFTAGHFLSIKSHLLRRFNRVLCMPRLSK